MKACVLHNIGDLRYEDVARPEPGDGEVLLRIRASGICGSDVQRVFSKGTYHFPTIPGHEFAGEIVSAGGGVSSSLIGRRAAVFPLIPCMKCSLCSVGEYAQCKEYNYYGSRCDGGFAEYLAVKEWNLVFVPPEVSFEEAAMCEPAAVAIHALSQTRIDFGDSVTIYGAGTIGLILGKIAKARGASKVILVDIDSRKLDFAQSLGFEYTVNSLNGDAPAAIYELTCGRGSDVTVEGTGVSAALADCLRSAAAFGRVVLMGNPAGDMNMPREAYWEILRKQLTLSGTWNSSYNGMKNDWNKAIEAMPDLNLKQLITHRFDFSRCGEAFEVMRDPGHFTVKVMFINDK
jgi:L-iditol 2-dehydrogenase